MISLNPRVTPSSHLSVTGPDKFQQIISNGLLWRLNIFETWNKTVKKSKFFGTSHFFRGETSAWETIFASFDNLPVGFWCANLNHSLKFSTVLTLVRERFQNSYYLEISGLKIFYPYNFNKKNPKTKFTDIYVRKITGQA